MEEDNLLELIIIKRQFNLYIKKLKYFLVFFILVIFLYKIHYIYNFSYNKYILIKNKLILEYDKLDDKLFSIDKKKLHLIIEGSNYYRKENIENIIKNSTEKKINLKLLNEIEQELKNILLIKEFNIRRVKFINTLKINIKEEIVIANYINEFNSFFLLENLSILKIDERDLNKYDQNNNIKIIDNSASNHLNLEEELSVLLKNQKVKDIVKEIHILENERMNLILKNYDIIIKLPFDFNQTFLDKIIETLNTYKEKMNLIEIIDARVNNKIYIVFKLE